MRGEVSIRTAGPEDAGAIAYVHVESWRTTYAGIVPTAYLAGLDVTLRTKMWSSWLGGETLVLVAELDGKIVGFAHGGPNRHPVETCDAELYAIYLLRETHGHGIGTALLHAMAAALVERNFNSMAVWVLEQNRSRVFYERAGARLARSKVIEVGGVKLMEVAYCWPHLKAVALLT